MLSASSSTFGKPRRGFRGLDWIASRGMRLLSLASRGEGRAIAPLEYAPASIPGSGRRPFVGDDQPAQSVEQKAWHSTRQERQHPQQAYDRRIDPEIVGHAARDTRQHAVVARAIESFVQLHALSTSRGTIKLRTCRVRPS